MINMIKIQKNDNLNIYKKYIKIFYIYYLGCPKQIYQNLRYN